ncbi:MAG: hypothetical protein J6W13_05065 [Salinivirgaceae bacterium]|nr:hypothetical protein [Salinivirgaceae bacterium]
MTILRKQENKEGEWIMIIKGLDYSFQSMELSESLKSLITYEESIKAFDSFVIVWDEYKLTPDFQSCPNEIKTGINQLINEIKSLENEEE